MLYEVFEVLSNISEDMAQVLFYTNHNGSISIHFNKINDNQHFMYELVAKDISELHQILKDTEQNTFINFLSKNNLFFNYKDKYFSCYKMLNKKVFSIDKLHINNFSLSDMNYIMRNINNDLNLIDLTYFSVRLLLPVQEDIKKEFIAALPEYKIKLFLAIFSIKKNIDYSNYALDDIDIANLYNVTKNNIVETYKKKKVEQYEVLRLGATCKAYGIEENDLLEIIKNYKLKRIDKVR